jgi:hypothetical protein
MPPIFSRRTATQTLTAVPLTMPWMAKVQAQATASTPPPLQQARLNALQADPALAGHRVYRADVFPLGTNGAHPLFSYARHVQVNGTDLVASHLTYLPDGELIIEERVTSSTGYAFRRFDVANKQTGLFGSVTLEGTTRELQFERPDTNQPRIEPVSAPVVAGPNLHGHILQHWDALVDGARLPVRLVVLARMETLGFTVHRLASRAGATAFQITPSHLLMRLVIAPLRVVFDDLTRRVVRYEGRVPPLQRVGTRLVDLDAAVHYHWDTDRYL